MDRDEFSRKTARYLQILEALAARLGPTSMNQITEQTGCAWMTLDRLLKRGGPPTQTSGPARHKLGGAELHEWLCAALPGRSAEEEAAILRAVADDIEAGEA